MDKNSPIYFSHWYDIISGSNCGEMYWIWHIYHLGKITLKSYEAWGGKDGKCRGVK